MDSSDMDSGKIIPRLTSIEFLNGQTLELKSGQVLLVTGPNNSGKTTLLREILDYAQNGSTSGPTRKILKSASFNWNLDPVDKREFIASNFPAIEDADGLRYHLPRQVVHPFQLARSIESTDGLRDLVSAFVKFDDAIERVNESDFQEKTDTVTHTQSMPKHPIENIHSDQELFSKLIKAFHEIFFEHLTLDDYGRQIGFRLGKDNFVQTPRRQALDEEEVKKVRDLPIINDQGFGMRATLGLLMSLLSGQESLVLIDEPEAFLHPPQAKKLSETITRIARETGKVIVVATHDRNIINGASNDSESKTSLIHLSRKENKTSFKLVDFESLSKVKANSLIRYSPILEALFHKVTIVVEGESDAVFYSAAFENFLDRNAHDYSISSSDVLILPVGGKDSQATTTKILKHLDCEVVVISDFDIFSDDGQLKKIWTALGNEWSLLNKPYRAIKNQVDLAKEVPTSCSIFEQIEDLKDRHNSNCFSEFSSLRKAIHGVLKTASPWADLKEHGCFEPNFGELFSDIRNYCLEGQLAIVPGGEVESFGRGLPNFQESKNSDWAMLAIDSGVHQAKSTIDFVKEILSQVFDNTKLGIESVSKFPAE